MTADSTHSLGSKMPDFSFIQAFAAKAEVIFWVADPTSYQLVYVSAHAKKVLGLPTDVWLRPLFWQTHLFEADRERVLTALHVATTSETVEHIEYRMVAEDGSLVWLRDRICTVVKEGTTFLCGMMTDVTAFKTAVDHYTDTPGYTRIFLEIVTLLSGNEELDQKLEQLAEKLCYVFSLTAVSIMNWDTVSHFTPFNRQDADTFLPEYFRENRLTEFIDGLGWQQLPAQPVLSHYDDPNLPDWQQAHLQMHQAKTILFVPISREDEIIGCIEFIDNRAVRDFAASDIGLSRFVAQQAALAIARAQLFEAEARRRREAEILSDVAEFVSSSLDRDEILSRVMEILRVYLSNVHNCSISLITEDGLQLETILSWSADEAYALFPRGTRIEISNSFTSQLALEGG
jgi:GAF domain-containing protein